MTMAKNNLPKVISRANKEIATIIENDIQQESKLLKTLVDDVLAANLEVKKKNNQRITDTRRKLQELDIEIDELNDAIDRIDRDTVIEQLNHMIDAENSIFQARQEIRFFENERLADELGELDGLYHQLADSIRRTKRMEDAYRTVVGDSNDALFERQRAITTELMDLLQEMVREKHDHVRTQLEQIEGTRHRILEQERAYLDHIDTLFADWDALSATSKSGFSDTDNERLMGEQITLDHNARLEAIQTAMEAIAATYETNRQAIIEEFHQYEADVRSRLNQMNQEALDAEQAQRKQKEDKLKNIRLLIIDAEKKQDFTRVQSLLKQFEKIEKTNISKVTDQTERLLEKETAATRQKAIQQLRQLEQRRIIDEHKQQLEHDLEQINYEEAKILFKIQSDRDGLQGDLALNKQKLKRLETFFHHKQETMRTIHSMRLDLRLLELDILQENELREQQLATTFASFVSDLAEMERKRLLTLQENVSNHDIIKIEQQFEIAKAALDLELSRDLEAIDKRILKTRNESLIRIEKQKEDATAEIIYQESLIEIAKKERELQLKKVHSLYENERGLAEEQVERIQLGIQVNDAFVKTTLENQLLFARQQIACAKSEFDIRVENINLTKDQEIAYAMKKIDYYKQKYEYEKSKLRKERDDRLEDLQFKLVLFTDKKDNAQIQEQIDAITERYQGMIDEIEAVEAKDPDIKRYEVVIDAAEARAAQAIEEAAVLRDQTIQAFETLHDQTAHKVDQIQEHQHSQDTVGILPLLNSDAVSAADKRLQQAIQEAESLYEDRIKQPNAIIQQTKEDLLKITQDEETEAFIQRQKDAKKRALAQHAERLAELEETMAQALEDTTDEVDRAKLIQQKLLQYQYESTTEATLRKPEDIHSDYEQLKANERHHNARLIEDIDHTIQNRLERHKDVLTETTRWIKQALKPYKRYIKKASKGLRAEKKDRIRQHKRDLKKALAQAEADFQSPL
jgi:hypothetical protein